MSDDDLNLDIGGGPLANARKIYKDYDDDKYGKARWQRQRAFYGYCSRDSAGFLCAGLALLIFAIAAIIFGLGYNNVPGLNKPPPTTNEDGGDGLDISGVSGNVIATNRLTYTCPATQEMVEGACIRKFNYPTPLDGSMMDNGTEPCKDFYDYACGAYAYDPRNAGQDATFTYMYSDNAQMIHGAIYDAPKDSQLGKFYQTCLDHEAEPFDITHYTILPQLLSLVNELPSTPLEEVIARLMQWDVLLPFRFSLELNPLNTRSTTPTFIRAGLTDDPEYVGSDQHIAYIRRRFQFVVEALGWSPSTVTRKAQLVADVEMKLLQGWPSPEDENQDLISYMDESMTGDIMPYEAFKSLMGSSFDIDAFVRHFATDYDIGLDTDVWIFKEPYFRSLASAFSQLSTEHWNAYLIHSILFSVIDPIPHHTPELYYIYHHGYDAEHALPWKRRGRFTTHDSLAVNRQQRCLQITAAYLPVIVDEYFVEEIPAFGRAKRAVNQIMKAIKEELARQIRPFEERAADKVLSIDVMAGTPDNWPIDRSNLKISDDSHADNILRIRRFHQELMVKTMCADCDVSPEALFDYPLYWVNAYFQHQLNTIVINAGIMKPPVFSALYSELGQMARLGVIVGHETGHSIDMTGSLFDSTGSFDSLLSSEDEERYEDNAQCFIDLYTERTKFGNIHNGALTLNENIADIVGFRTAFNVMFADSDPNSEEVREQKRQFFLIYAQTWCQASTAEQERQFIEHSVHSTSRMRVNKVVSQVEDFYDVFDCQDMKPTSYCNIFRNLLKRKVP